MIYILPSSALHAVLDRLIVSTVLTNTVCWAATHLRITLVSKRICIHLACSARKALLGREKLCSSNAKKYRSELALNVLVFNRSETLFPIREVSHFVLS